MQFLYERLCRYDAGAWQRAIDLLAGEIHPIDRNATNIWFAFYPLDLFLALEASDDQPALVRRMGLMGNWRLADQIDTSHRFFYAHRYWPQIKHAIQNTAEVRDDDLAALINRVADGASRTARVDRERLTGLTAVGLMTLRQSGVERFAASPGAVYLSARAQARSPHQVLKARARDDGQGLLGFTRGLKKQWSVTFDENEPDAKFTLINGQEIATAAQTDKRDYRSRDPRCIPGEGPIPVECRAASCGTCWVGVLGGAEKLSPVVDRDERRRMRVFGYLDSNDDRPIVRLACQARAFGAVSIVIPPWNGIFATCVESRRARQAPE
jgi:ferredoxin